MPSTRRWSDVTKELREQSGDEERMAAAHARLAEEEDMSEIHDAAELILDTLDAYEDAGYYDRTSGVIDMQVGEIAGALLAAGWQVPRAARRVRKTPAE